MNIYINNELKILDNQKSIAGLLTELNLASSKGIAVAINNQVIPKNIWDSFSVSENDRVTIIKATQGG